MKIAVKFLEPFRMMKWMEKSRRNKFNPEFVRGQAFARWHKDEKSKKGRPFITGTLLRSAVIRSAENLLQLSGGIIEGEKCCPGKFHTEKSRKMPRHLRQRSTLKWNTDRKVCEKGTHAPCPFCELLGCFDKAVKRAKKEDGGFHIHFGNLNLPGSPLYADENEIAFTRVLNRIDQSAGKAHDFFRIYEADHMQFPEFEGEITIAEGLNPATRQLLEDSLCFTDRLCGALCIIHFEKDADAVPFSGKNLSIEEQAVQSADFISALLEKKNESEHSRMAADAIKLLRRDRKLVSDLPKNHENEEKHYIWDIGKEGNGISLRKHLEQKAEEISNQHDWRTFCEITGNLLYRKIKEQEGGLRPAQRIIGDAQFHGEPSPPPVPGMLSSMMTTETLLLGKLTAETPFFFGKEYSGTDQTDLQILLTPDNRYRVPRSAIRGILRRDLSAILGKCNAELGGRPCMCGVCRIMRNITLMDNRSQCTAPPEIRHRIRINPFTGTVAEAALFSMETAPEGLEFDFVLRYRGQGSELPDPLKNILRWWTEGQAFLSGAAATGKGRFSLDKNLQKAVLHLSDETKRKEYLENRGWRENPENIPVKMLPEPLDTNEYKYKKPLWQKVEISIELDSPFLNGDPVRAMVKGKGADTVTFVKYKAEAGKQELKTVYALKSESFRGIVRSAVGRIHEAQDSISGEKGPLTALKHQDCECLLCRVFGSEYESGKLRFEDLEFAPQPEPVKIDHVAIDRFTGGAVNQKKFDDCPLPGSPKTPLKLAGCFWVHRDLLENEEESKALGRAFADIRNGMYPLGGKGAIGYGRVAKLEINGDNGLISKWMKTVQPANEPQTPAKTETQALVNIHPEKYYYPHYFLKPHAVVNREPVPTGHETFHPDRLSGKIRCRLNCKTPLFVSNALDENISDPENPASDDSSSHKSYAFFRLNDEIMIPGSEIRGMVSTVYEALTNSCFRIFDEKYRLSWRMEALPDTLKLFRPGRVRKNGDGFVMEILDEVRYPYYDQWITDNEKQDAYFTWTGKGKPEYDHPTDSDR
ncbi:MAG: type III-E CRISPR-associated gRAMP effector Cas7-11, partial [Desulfococcaceae bacterium]|nr:type III-E CRISPR-associated gRAMP effector Cas7-11 [Desulfococcaceae bacterium]